MPRSDQDAVPAFPLRLIRFSILAEAIDFVFSDRSYSAFFPRDIASAVTMSLLYVFYVSFIAFSVGEISHASVPASLPRFRFCLIFLSLRGFLFRCCLHRLSELRHAITCSIILPPRSGLFRAFSLRSAPCLRRGLIFLIFVRVSVKIPFSQLMVHCSTSFRLFRS